MRSTIIGHTLDQLHRAAGWTVIADNHIGDWGKQFGMLIVMWNRAHDAEAFAQDPIGELERLYVGFSQISTPELGSRPPKGGQATIWRPYESCIVAAIYRRVDAGVQCCL